MSDEKAEDLKKTGADKQDSVDQNTAEKQNDPKDVKSQETAASAEEKAAPNDMTEALKKASADVKILQDELSKAKDDSLRAAAEMQNIRKRCATDIDKAKKYSIESFVNDLLPAIDPMEKAITSVEDFSDEVQKETKTLIDGVTQTMKLLFKALESNGVQKIIPEPGDKFDPSLHNAAIFQESPDIKKDCVITTFQSGYVLNGRVVRPAMVVVSKGK